MRELYYLTNIYPKDTNLTPMKEMFLIKFMNFDRECFFMGKLTQPQWNYAFPWSVIKQTSVEDAIKRFKELTIGETK